MCLNARLITLDNCQLIIKVTDLGGIEICSDDFGLCVGFGVRLAGEEQRVVLDDARKRLEAFVNRQGHGCSCHLTNDLSRKRHNIKSTACEILPDK